MDISSLLGLSSYPYLSSYGGNYLGMSYPYQSLAAGGLNFSEVVQKAQMIQKVAAGQALAASLNAQTEKSGMVVAQPPDYSGFTYDDSISEKSKDEMSLEEYKQWFKNEMSKMPVSEWYRSTCAGGSLVITEEAFERMKQDPGWEKTVTEMVRKMYSGTGISGSKMLGFQVIGASEEECFGEGIPVSATFSASGAGTSQKSWWETRNQKSTEAASAVRRTGVTQRRKLSRRSYTQAGQTESKRIGRYFNASL